MKPLEFQRKKEVSSCIIAGNIGVNIVCTMVIADVQKAKEVIVALCGVFSLDNPQPYIVIF